MNKIFCIIASMGCGLNIHQGQYGWGAFSLCLTIYWAAEMIIDEIKKMSK